MRIQIVHGFGPDAGILQRVAHAAECAVPVFRRRGHVERVRRHAVAGELAVDARAALFRVLVFLEHHRTGTFAQHETVAVLVPGPACASRVVVARRHGARRTEAAHREFRDGGLRAARDHDFGVAVADRLCRLADAMRGGRAGGDDGEVRALGTQHDRQVAGDHVDDGTGNEERRDAPRAILQQLVMHFLDQRQAAHARAEIDAEALGRLRRHRVAGILPGLLARRHAEMDEAVHAARFLRRQVFRDVEILHLAGDLAGEARRIEAGDAGDAGLAGENGVPGFRDRVPDRADDPQPGDDDSAALHCCGRWLPGQALACDFT